MEFSTLDYWDDAIWSKAERVYDQAFAGTGEKSQAMIRKLFAKQMSFLHVAFDNSEVIAMALTGKLEQANALLIDYLAVRLDLRRHGIGFIFMDYIKGWTAAATSYDGIIIEIESENSPTNLHRYHFWEKCGFTLTNYIHQYIWVPEPYQAMYLNLNKKQKLPADGETLFQYITDFHKKAYRGK